MNCSHAFDATCLKTPCFAFLQELYGAAYNVARELLNTERTYVLKQLLVFALVPASELT